MTQWMGLRFRSIFFADSVRYLRKTSIDTIVSSHNLYLVPHLVPADFQRILPLANVLYEPRFCFPLQISNV
jgi:hypothetical protein